MTALTDYLEEELLKYLLRGATGPFVDPMYVSLHTDDPGETAAGANEVSTADWTNYVRVAIQTDNVSTQFTAPVTEEGGFKSDTSVELDFGTATIVGGDVVLKGASLKSLATGGNAHWAGPLGTVPKPFAALAVDNKFYSKAHGFSNDNKLVLIPLPGRSLPTGVSTFVEYFVVSVATDNFQLALTQGGAAIDLTTDGDGIAFLSGFQTISNGNLVKIPVGSLKLGLR